MKTIYSRLFISVFIAALAGCAGMPNIPNLPIGKLGLGLMPGSGGTDNVATLISAGKNFQEATREIPESEEIEMGEAVAAGMLGAAPLLKNDRIQRYVNQVGRWIALHSERPGLPWRFAVMDTLVPNAFAAPGGQVFITTGLLYRMRSESELAGALGHEIAHVVSKHHLKAITKSGWLGLGKDAATLLIDSKVKSGTVGTQIAKGWVKGSLSGVKELYVKGLDRDDELQADRMGMALAARAGYDPYGLPTVLQLLQDISKEQSSAISLLYRSHPTPEVRLAELDKAIGKSLDQYATQPILQDRFITAMLGTLPVDLKKDAAPAKAAPKAVPKKP